jgi:type I restriction enzyme S subunit
LYLHFVKMSHNGGFSEFTSHSTIAHLTGVKLRSIPIPLPPLDEQRRIVDLLERAAGLRRLREQALAKARAIVPALFLDMFGDPATNPKGWPVVKLGSLLAKKPNYGTMKKPTAGPSAWIDLRVGNIRPAEIDLSGLKYVELEANEIERHTVHDGDLLVVRAIGSEQHLGKVAVARPNGARWAFDSHLMRVRLEDSRALPEFIALLLAQRPRSLDEKYQEYGSAI